MASVRHASTEARPVPVRPQTLEMADPRLTNALGAALAAPSPRSYRAVASEYKRLGVYDRAHQYLSNALLLDGTDAATYDAMARLWRDGGFPQLGLPEAYRAVFYAPASATARNTLGTVLQALGRRDLARQEYQRAIELDQQAAYAFNNLCYSWTLEGEAARAIAACEQALAIAPNLAAARNNLGLAHAVAGHTAEAQRAFASSGDKAAALYNTGIVHLARREYKSAVEAFQAAHAARPGLTSAVARARQARAAAAAHAEE